MKSNPKDNGSKSELYQEYKGGQFKKGNPGGGRPAGTLSLVGLLKKKLGEVEPKNKKTYATLLIDRIIKDAIAGGDAQQIKNILQYIEGMPKQTIDSKLEMSGLQELFKDARE